MDVNECPEGLPNSTWEQEAGFMASENKKGLGSANKIFQKPHIFVD